MGVRVRLLTTIYCWRLYDDHDWPKRLAKGVSSQRSEHVIVVPDKALITKVSLSTENRSIFLCLVLGI